MSTLFIGSTKYFKLLLFMFGATAVVKKSNKVFSDDNAPNYVPELYFKNISIIKNPKMQYIVKSKVASEILYAILVKKDTSDPIEVTDYMYNRYSHLQVTEKAILYTMLKIGNDIVNRNMIMDLQKKMNTSFPQSNYIWLGTFLLSLYFLFNLTDNPMENYEAIRESIECVITQEDIFQNNRKYKTLLFFIGQYYLCEYYLSMISSAFRSQRYNEVIVYSKKLLLRHKIHPIAAMEALFYLLEVMLILDFKELVILYKEAIETNIKENVVLQKRQYYKRLLYILQIYNFSL